MKVNGKLLLMRKNNERIHISVYENCSRACSSCIGFPVDDSRMSKYQFYSIMFPLWFIIAMVAKNPFVVVVAFVMAALYAVGSLLNTWRKE